MMNVERFSFYGMRTLLALYMVIRSPQLGILIKQAGVVELADLVGRHVDLAAIADHEDLGTDAGEVGDAVLGVDGRLLLVVAEELLAAGAPDSSGRRAPHRQVARRECAATSPRRLR